MWLFSRTNTLNQSKAVNALKNWLNNSTHRIFLRQIIREIHNDFMYRVSDAGKKRVITPNIYNNGISYTNYFLIQHNSTGHCKIIL